MADNRHDRMRETPLWRPLSFLDAHTLDQPGHYAEALNVYNDLIARDPTNMLAYILQGRVLRNLHRNEEARSSFLHALHLAEQVIAKDPNNVRAHVYRADALWMLKRREGRVLTGHIEALAAYDQAIQLAPEDYEAYLNKGWAQVVLGHYREALILFERAHELRPDDADIIWRINIAYWHSGQYDKALEALERAIALDPSQSRFYGDLATTVDSLGRHEEATELQARAEAMEAQELSEALVRYEQMVWKDT